MTVSVVLCTRNPRQDYLRRVFAALDAQTLPKQDWELIVVDSASSSVLATTIDLSWHPAGRHVREDTPGLTRARFRGIDEARGELLVFLDDDNVLAPDFLTRAISIAREHAFLGVFGPAVIEPEFEVQPSSEVAARAELLTVRAVAVSRWSSNPRDFTSIPWGAGLCVTRAVADAYRPFVDGLGAEVGGLLGRTGGDLYCGEDDVFSWAAVSRGSGFGIFPDLRLTHLIPAGRVTRRHILRLQHDHSLSHGVLQYRLTGARPQRIAAFRYVHLLLHGLRNGRFSMQCQWAASRGEDRAARLIDRSGLQPARALDAAVLLAERSGGRPSGESG